MSGHATMLALALKGERDIDALTAALGREPVAHEIEDAIAWADQGQFEDS